MFDYFNVTSLQNLLNLFSLKFWPAASILPLHALPSFIDLFKANNRNTIKRCEIYSKLINTPEKRH